MPTRTYPKQPCHECPFIAKIPGWLGSYDDPHQLIELILAEQEMP